MTLRIEEHVSKAERIEASLRRALDWDADYELAVEACMLAGTHWLNAVLHHRDVTPTDADLAHSDKPPLDQLPPEDIAEMMAALKGIEEMRPGYLRGSRPWRRADGETCRDTLAMMRTTAHGILGRREAS